MTIVGRPLQVGQILGVVQVALDAETALADKAFQVDGFAGLIELAVGEGECRVAIIVVFVPVKRRQAVCLKQSLIGLALNHQRRMFFSVR